MRSLAYCQGLCCRRDLNGIQTVGGATDKRGTKAEDKAREQKLPNRTTSEHVGLLTLLYFQRRGGDRFCFHRRVCHIKKGRRREISLTHVLRSIFFADASLYVPEQTESHFLFWLICIGINCLGTWRGLGGVIARIQGVAERDSVYTVGGVW